MNLFLIANRKSVSLIRINEGEHGEEQTQHLGWSDSAYQDVFSPDTTLNDSFNFSIEENSQPVVDLILDSDLEQVEAIEWAGRKSVLLGLSMLRAFVRNLQSDYSDGGITTVCVGNSITFVVLTKLTLPKSVGSWLLSAQENHVRIRSVKTYSQLVAETVSTGHSRRMHIVIELHTESESSDIRQHCVLAGKSLYSGVRRIETGTEIQAIRECLTFLSDEGIVLQPVPVIVMNTPSEINSVIVGLEALESIHNVLSVEHVNMKYIEVGGVCSRNSYLVGLRRQSMAGLNHKLKFGHWRSLGVSWLRHRPKSIQGVFQSIQQSFETSQSNTRYRVINILTLIIAIAVSATAGLHALEAWQAELSRKKTLGQLTDSTLNSRTQAFELFPQPVSLVRGLEFVELMSTLKPFDPTELWSMLQAAVAQVSELQLKRVGWSVMDDQIELSPAGVSTELVAKHRTPGDTLQQPSHMEVTVTGSVTAGHSPRRSQQFVEQFSELLQAQPSVLRIGQSRTPADDLTDLPLNEGVFESESSGEYRIVFVYKAAHNQLH